VPFMTELETFGRYLRTTDLSWAVAGGYPWIWPLCETLHFVGLCMLVGIAGGLDLRMLGLAKGYPIASLQRLIPFAILGFFINLVTGVLFFIGAPFQYLHNYPFGLKMLFIALAGLNVAAFQWLGLSKAVDEIGPGGDAPFGAKVVAATSLVLWIGVMFWGRMLPFLGNAI
jgi:hypothetical protein